ncbi:type II toxin-antitoxin system Phd/YefM family antitoxin [Paracoccaceae bacterium]|nr:type II toxin-antitoxin system Phd/YefM family antitoxin [Paracoccaceae bacterium]
MTDAKNKMKQICIQGFQANFEQVLDYVLLSGKPIKIMKDTENAIFVSDEVWCGMTEALHLLSIPGMRDSIRSSMCKSIAHTTTGLDW